jgi:hypothetical protein
MSETTQDETAHDETAGDETAGDTTAEGPDPHLLEELDEHIREARNAAEEALGGTDQTFVESGDERSEAQDDQTIAPPG